ncbi:MAG: hypothetical protein ABIM30_00110 [candidate division WOR-3 bacterium]
MDFSKRILISGLVHIRKIDNGVETWSKVVHNKINNNLKIAIGHIICNSSSINRNYCYINQMRIYGVTNQSDLTNITPPSPVDDFPNRHYILKEAPASMNTFSNVVPGVNLFSATVQNDDKLNGENVYYISDIVLSGINGATGEQEVWSRLLAPSDSSGPIGLLKTPSVSYRIDWYIIFEQE